MTPRWLASLPETWRADGGGVPSVCSAHPSVIRAALAASAGAPVLIEATCNQVNQEGGYTGMIPADFARNVHAAVADLGLDPAGVVLGGDHLGPNPWRDRPAEEAMERAESMVRAYVAAGFGKIHLDASMGCRGEPAAPGDEVVAERAARLARAAEEAAKGDADGPVYVIGTEVPTPGGATHDLGELAVTSPEAARETIACHRRAFDRAGIGEAFARVIAVVVQPGVEFDHEAVVDYAPEKARALSEMLADEPAIVFEAHSTDYQTPAALAALVADGFPILKVGPALTFALREALYGLDRIAEEIDPQRGAHSLRAAMERLMLAEPRYWASHYRGTPERERLLRHYSYSDRIRYYWAMPEAGAAVAALMRALGEATLPATLVSQYLPGPYAAMREGRIEARPRALVGEAIRQAFAPYRAATAGRMHQNTNGRTQA